VVDGGQGALIDSGLGDEEAIAARLEYIRRLNLRLAYIIITHSHLDHSGGADALRRATGAPILMHRQEEPFIGRGPEDLDVPPERLKQWREAAARARPDRLLEDGEGLPLGSITLEVIHTPGHTPGSLCIWLPQEKALFTGDMVLGMGTVVVPPPPYGDMILYLESLRRLLSLDASLLLPGHGPPVRQPALKLQELIDHRRERDEQVLAALRRGRRTVKEILPDIYPELDSRLVPMASQQILSHLEKLRREGRVIARGEGDKLSYYPA